MPKFAALIYTEDADWAAPEHAELTAQYAEFGAKHGASLRGGEALKQTHTAKTVRVTGARPGEVITADGPYAEATEVLAGFYVIEADDIDAAVVIAADIPSAAHGAVEVRPVLSY